jgi:hypothetical protein
MPPDSAISTRTRIGSPSPAHWPHGGAGRGLYGRLPVLPLVILAVGMGMAIPLYVAVALAPGGGVAIGFMLMPGPGTDPDEYGTASAVDPAS